MSELTTGEQLQSLVNIESIKQGEEPWGKCDDWNMQLANQYIDQGIDATVVAEPDLDTKDLRGNRIDHHAIALIKFQDSWFVSDLSVAQIRADKENLWLSSHNLKDLQQKLIQEIGGKWKVFEDEEKIVSEIDRWRNVRSERNRLKKQRRQD